MAQFVRSHLEQICSPARHHCPRFVVVKMRIATWRRKKGMRQYSTWSIECHSIAMFTSRKTNCNVHFACWLCLKSKICVWAPHSECFFKFCIYFGASQTCRIIVDTIGKGFVSPATGYVWGTLRRCFILDSATRRLDEILCWVVQLAFRKSFELYVLFLYIIVLTNAYRFCWGRQILESLVFHWSMWQSPSLHRFVKTGPEDSRTLINKPCEKK